MDENFKEKLKKMLENGEISEEIFNDIVNRWSDDSNTQEIEKEDKDEEEEIDRDRVVRISGIGSLSDVNAHKLSISGAGKVSGKVLVDIMHISGSGKVDSDIESRERISVSGVLRTEGNVKGNSLEVSGSLTAKNLECKSVDNSGSLKIDEKIDSDLIKVSGSLRAKEVKSRILESSGSIVAGNIEGENVKIYGRIKSDKVKCDNFNLETWGGDSSVDELEAKDVNITMKRKFLFPKRRVEFDTIKAERVDVENVESSHIIADEAIIGDYCDIDLLEARTIKISDKANVKEKKILGSD